MDLIKNEKVIQSNYLYYSTKTEFHIKLKEYESAKMMLKTAIDLAPLPKEKEMLKNRYLLYFDKKE